mgnify:CR=1 FL=1
MKNKILISFIAILCLLLLASIGYVVIYGAIPVSESSRNGYLQKFGSKYIFWTTYEGELALHGSGGSNTGKQGQPSSSYSNTWSFSVDDKNITKQIEEIQNNENDSAKAVTLFYKEYYFSGWHDTNYRITKVIWLSNPNKPKTPQIEYFK